MLMLVPTCVIGALILASAAKIVDDDITDVRRSSPHGTRTAPVRLSDGVATVAVDSAPYDDRANSGKGTERHACHPLTARQPPQLTMPAVGTATAMTVLAASHTFVDLVSGSIGALLPTLKDRFELNSMQASALVATIAASTALTTSRRPGRRLRRCPPRRRRGRRDQRTVPVADRRCTAPLMVFGMIVIGGLGSAAYHPAAAVLTRRALPERAQFGMSLLAAGGMLGMALGPIAVLFIAAHAGLGFTPLLMIPGVALGAVLWRFLPGEPRTATPPQPGVARKLLRGRSAT